MDPNSTLDQLRRLVAEIDTADETSNNVADLATHFEALDGWLCRGGFLPRAWESCKPRAATFWAHFRTGKTERKLGPFATREEAYAAALPHKPKTVTTGYGTDSAMFDLRWRDLNYRRSNYADSE